MTIIVSLVAVVAWIGAAMEELMDEEKPIWSINDVAAFVGGTLETVRRMLVAGELPAGHRSGKHVFWYPDEVRSWREQHGRGL